MTFNFEFSILIFFFKSQLLYPTKNAPPLDTRVSESLSHIQTHLILNNNKSHAAFLTQVVSPTPLIVTEGRRHDT